MSASLSGLSRQYDSRLQLHGAGAPLVYVPGMDGTGQLFYTQIPALAKRWRVATYALRDSARDMETLLADLDVVLRAASPREEPAILVAESFGGAVAMTYALSRPERIRALVVLNSFPFFKPQRRLRLGIAALWFMPWGAMRLVRRFTAFRLHSRHTHRREIRRFLALTAATTKEGYVNRLRILTHYDIRDRLARLGVPVLYLAADQDHLIPSVQQAALMAGLAPNASTLVLRGHGHSCFLAHSLDLSAILADWFAARAA